jgi:hypothetical protein
MVHVPALDGLLFIIVLSFIVFVIVGISTIIKIRGANKTHNLVPTPKLLIVPGYEEWEITTDLEVLHIRDGFVYFSDGSYVNLANGAIRNLGTSTIDVFNNKTGEAFSLKPLAEGATEQ